MNTSIDVLKNCTVHGFNVRLPQVQLDRKLYLEVSKKLELIGGKWNRKEGAFVFEDDPTELLETIAGGEEKNLKKEYQFFETPEELADALVDYADLQQHHHVLEPSAGRGALIAAILRLHPSQCVNYCEIMDLNLKYLQQKFSYHSHMHEDFMELHTSYKFDRIIANPPFAKNQDIDHIMKMYQHLNPGGRMVSMAGKHWQFAKFKKETAFREWLEQVGAEIIPVEEGTFKKSGTMIGTNIIIIDK